MTVLYSKDPATAQQPASTTKVLTAVVMNDYVNGTDLDTTVVVTSEDVVDPLTNSNMGLQVGDIISYRDLLFGMILPSGNDAANCIARNVGALISGIGDPYNNFINAMTAKASSLGMSTAVIVTPSGVGETQRMSANDLSLAMIALAGVPYLVEVAGTLTHTVTITGSNARSYDVTHTVNPDGVVKFPEFIAAKTGTYTSSDPANNSGACLVMLWQKSPSVLRISVVMNSSSDIDRYRDMRKLIDYEKANVS